MTGSLSQLLPTLLLLALAIAGARRRAADGHFQRPAFDELPHPPPKLLAGLCLALGLATLAVYVPSLTYDFVNFDDPFYVVNNAELKNGFSAANVAWAFTTFRAGNWHPLTWLSLLLDRKLFGPGPAGAHAANVFFHLGAALFLFLAFARMTRQAWRSALVAALFALHPLHVESVAWISERKDVLSGFFAGLTLLLYARYAEAPSPKKYLAMTAAFACGLLAKSMLVTLPCVLLLLDVWPLGRIAPAVWPPDGAKLKRLLLEKAPLLALSAVAAALNVLSHRSYSFFVSFADLPLSARAANAAMSSTGYIAKAFWPAKLAMFYPYHPPLSENVLAAAALLAAVTLACLMALPRRPYLAVGWLWYLGMLFPVSGLMQNGVQAMADRYAYLPLVGLSVAVIWLAADLAAEHAVPRGLAGAFAVAVVAVFAALSWRQAGVWKNSGTLFAHTLAVTENNSWVHNILGMTLGKEGRFDEAGAQFREALAIDPKYIEALDNYAGLLAITGHNEDAVAQATKAIGLARGQDAFAETSLCIAFTGLGRHEEAENHCRVALRLVPEDPTVHFSLGQTLMSVGHKDEAAAEFTRALALDPGFPGARAALDKLQGKAPPRADPAPL